MARGKHLSLLTFPLPSISLVSLAVLVLHLGSFGHLIVDLASCIRERCFLASEHCVLLFAGDNVYVGLCSLCVPTFCATSAFLSMTGCRKGLFGPVLTPFQVWGADGGAGGILLTPAQLICMQQKKCSQIGKEIPVYDSSVHPPSGF